MGYLGAGILGLILGYLVNYFSDVLPMKRKLVKPTCKNCNSMFSWKDYLSMHPCSNCGGKVSFRFYCCLCLGVIFSILIWVNPPNHLGYWLGILTLLYFGVVIVIDLENRLILHIVSIPGLFLGLLIGMVRVGFSASLIGGLVGFLTMLFFYWFGIQFARYRTRKLGRDDGEEAFGFGDVILSGIIGLMLTWPLIIYGLIIGILLGGIFSFLLIVYLLISKQFKTMEIYTAYGPYLVLGAAILIYIPQALS
jgi:leader peptidase (prepilin peptidase)/N-methyltransferase